MTEENNNPHEQPPLISRRGFFKEVGELAKKGGRIGAAMSVAAPLVSLVEDALGDEGGKKETPKLPPLDKNDKETLAYVFDGIKLTDQHGAPIKPEEVLREGPAVVMFGYGGCPKCQEISNTVSALQQRLVDKDKKVPIFVVSVQPQKDRDSMRGYVASYEELGIRQFMPQKDQPKTLPAEKEKRREHAQTLFDAYDAKDAAGKNAEQRERVLHIACPPDEEDSKTIQTRIGEALIKAGSKKFLFTSKDAKEHTAFLTIFNDGKAVEAYRSLNSEQKAPPVLADTVARDMAEKIEALDKDRRR